MAAPPIETCDFRDAAVSRCRRTDEGGCKIESMLPTKEWMSSAIHMMRLPDSLVLGYNRLLAVSLPDLGDVVLMLGAPEKEGSPPKSSAILVFHSFTCYYSEWLLVAQSIAMGHGLCFEHVAADLLVSLRVLFRDYLYRFEPEVNQMFLTSEKDDGLPGTGSCCKLYGEDFNMECSLVGFKADPKLSIRDPSSFGVRDFAVILAILGSYFQSERKGLGIYFCKFCTWLFQSSSLRNLPGEPQDERRCVLVEVCEEKFRLLAHLVKTRLDLDSR